MQQLQKQSTDVLVGTPQVLSSLLVYFSRLDPGSPPPGLGSSTSEAIHGSNERTPFTTTIPVYQQPTSLLTERHWLGHAVTVL
jgi:hypothetical protein